MTDEDNSEEAEDVVKNGRFMKGNSQAKTHGMFENRDKVWDSLSNQEKQMALGIAEDLLERLDEEAGPYERECIRNITIDQIKRSRANDYILMNDISESEGMHRAYKGLVSSMTREMKELGLKIDTEKERALDAEASWYEAMTDAMSDE